MNKESTVPTAIAFIAFVLIVIFFIFMIKGNVEKNKENADNREAQQVGVLDDFNVIIGGKKYVAKTESTKAAEVFLNNLPIEVEMHVADKNTIQGVTYFKLSSEVQSFKKVYVGDVLLEGNSNIIIVTSSYKTKDKYTKLGHIDDFNYIPNGNVRVYLSK